VVTIGPFADLRTQHPGARVLPRRRVVAPPPVNAHTHLDLARMPLTPGRYADFIAAVIAHGRAGGRSLAAAEARPGRAEGGGRRDRRRHRHRRGRAGRLLADPDLQGVAYWEVLGPDPADAEARFDAAVDVVRRHRPAERPGGVRLGLSPHTPHTVSAPLLQRLARFAAAERLPLQIHVAEDAAEVASIARGEGPLREALGRSWRFRPSGRSPVGYLDALGRAGGTPDAGARGPRRRRRPSAPAARRLRRRALPPLERPAR
jgi:aminodeoxyfutalosine deaminase